MTNDGHDLEFHQGEVLYRDLASTYDNLLLTLVEAAQNGIDADASTIFIGVDRSRRQAIVLDNGTGVEVEKFRQALSSVGKGIKRPGSLGRFGLGLVSPLNKCEWFTVTSAPEGSHVVNQWTFNGAKIREQRKIRIPYKQLRRLPPLPRGLVKLASTLQATWRTQLYLHEIKSDRATSVFTVDELKQHIRNKLGHGMRRKGVTIHVAQLDEHGNLEQDVIVPTEYEGDPLKVVTYTDEDECGKVEFELYLARKEGGVRKGNIVIMQLGDNYPIGWREFRTQAMGSGWLKEAGVKEAFEVLASGFFEGVIRVENIVLAPERTKFILNDALLATYIVLYRWFLDHGKSYYEAEQEARRDQRYQQLGEQSLQRLYALLQSSPSLASINPELLGFTEDPPPQEPPDEKDPETTQPRKKRVVARSPGSTPPRNKEASHNKKERQDKKDETRQPVTLSFAYEMLPGSPHLWVFDHATATLIFNIRHPVWTELDETRGKRTPKNDKQIMHLQEWLALEVLLLLAECSEPEQLEELRSTIDRRVKPYVAMFIHT